MWPILRQVLSITNEEQFQAIANAVRLYHSASMTADLDYGSAYLLLVSAVESLASVFEPGPARFEDWSEAKQYDEWISRVQLEPTAADELRGMLLRPRNVQLRQKFISLSTRSATEQFWSLPWEQCFPEIERGANGYRAFHRTVNTQLTPAAIGKERLRALLASIYDHRSAFVHAGDAFPLDASLDLPREVEVQVDLWTGRELKVSLPSLSWFERLAHATIQNCIDIAEQDEKFQLPDLVIQPPRIGGN